MTHRILIALTASLLFAQDPAKIDALFSSYGPTTPGCAVGIAREGKAVFARGYGMADLEHDVPISTATPFYMASVSKQFTAMSVLLLVEEGKVQLGDSIRKYFPELPDYANAVTIRHLLQHTSGVRDYLGLGDLSGYASELSFTDKSAMRMIARQAALNFEPGSEYMYSNSGYVLLSFLVKRVADRDLNTFASEKIFTPLGMKSTRFQHDHSALIPGKAFGYQMRGGGWHTSNSMLDVVGDGGLYSTVDDMLRWAANYNEPKVGARAIPIMQTRGHLNSGTEMSYGMGLAPGAYRGLNTIEHSGALSGYRTEFLRFPDQHLTVVCLCNAGSANPGRLAQGVGELYIGDRMKEAPATASQPATAVVLSDQELESKAGLYRSDKGGYIEIVTVDKGLVFRNGPGRLIPLDKNRFTANNASAGWDLAFDGDVLEWRRPGQSVMRLERTQPMVLSDADRAAYAGQYHSRELDASYRITSDGGLSLEYGDRTLHLRSTGKDRMTTDNAQTELRFERDAAGAVVGFRLDWGAVRGLVFRRF